MKLDLPPVTGEKQQKKAKVPKKGRTKRFWILGALGVLFFVAAVAAVAGYQWYKGNTLAVDAKDSENVIFVVSEGDSVAKVGQNLKSEGLIRNYDAFRWYIRLNEPTIALQPGAYELSKALSVEDIVNKLKEGEILVKRLTIIPGHTIFDVEESLLDLGYSQDEVNRALAADYRDHPAFKDAPEDATLEGYMAPNTYQAGYLQPPESLIRLSLNETARFLADEEITEGLQREELTPHEAIILTSIVVKESPDPEEQKKIAQVFIKRLREDISLGADPTFRYAARLLGVPDSVSIDSPYNTRIYKGLPPGPIGTITESALFAVANPADTDFLFFVAGDDGVIYYSKTAAEHEQKRRKYCIELCKL